VFDGMIQERCMHRFPHGLVSAKAEGYVAHPSAYVHMRKVLTDPFCSAKEIKGIIPVFINSGCNRENIRIENNVLRRKVHLVDQDIICAFANRYPPLIGICLTGFVKCHDYHSCTVSPDEFCLTDKLLLPCF